jgi:Putative beta-barrel porin 2
MSGSGRRPVPVGRVCGNGSALRQFWSPGQIRRTVAVGVALACLALPGGGAAQGLWTITPSLQVGEKYTDNLFGTAHNRESDFITQITPGLRLSYETSVTKLSLSYSATAELYADHSDLDNFGENQTGSVALDHRPDPSLRLRLAAYYDRTNDPSRFFVVTAAPPGTTVVPTVETTRRETTQVRLSTGADYVFTPRLTGRAGYDFAFLKQEGTDDGFSHTGSIGGDYQLTREDVGFSTASVSVLNSADSDTSASLLLGWRRQWSADLSTSVAAGPRVTDGTWGGAADLWATYLLGREWSVKLAYSLGTGLAAGTTGAQNVSTLSAIVTYQPLRDLRFSALGGWTRTWGIEGDAGDQTTNAYSAGVSADYRLTTWLTLTLSYRYALEEQSHGDSIPTNQVVLSLTAAYPWVPSK